jgi:lysozyme family protein
MTPDQMFAAAFPIVWKIENGGMEIAATDDPEDPGGYTRGGISLAENPDMTREQLEGMVYQDFVNWYHKNAWIAHNCNSLPWPLALVVYDGEVNQGGEGVKALQAALGINQDGSIGPITIAAANKGDPFALSAETMEQRDEAYHKSAKFKRFGRGWITRVFTVAFESAQVPSA